MYCTYTCIHVRFFFKFWEGGGDGGEEIFMMQNIDVYVHVGSASHAIHGASKHTVCSSVVFANDHACRFSVFMYTCND